MSALFSATIPIALIVLAGVWLERRFRLDPTPFTRTTLYVLTPALIAHTMYTSELPGLQAARLIGAFVLASAGWYGTARLLGSAARFNPATRRGLVASTMFPNMGNMGLPLVLLTFGGAGFDRAVVLFVTSALVVFGVGPALLRGGGLRAAVATAVRMPHLWAAALGIAGRLAGRAPGPLVDAVDLLGKAAVPILLLVLGMNVARSRVRWRSDVLVAAGGRLIAGPAIGFASARLLGLPAFDTHVMVLQVATPTAVNAMLLASEFGGDAPFTSQAVVASTLLSFITIPLLLLILGS